MHYNLLFNGCSYTKGSELEGIDHDCEYRDRHRYSHVISERLEKTYDNISVAGNSNDRIVRETLEWFNAGNTCDLAIIQWTEISRVEYISPYAKHPVHFNPQFVITNWGDKDMRKIKKDYEETQLAHEHFYKHYYNTMMGIYNFYKNLYVLEQFFEKNNINHYMIKLSPTIFSSAALFAKNQTHKLFLNDYPEDPKKIYWKTLCKHDFLNIPSIRDTMISNKDKENFTPDYRHLGHKYFNGTHPSELGHQRIADFIINKIDTK